MNFAHSPLSIQLTNTLSQRERVLATGRLPSTEKSAISVILVEDDDVDAEIVNRSLMSFDPKGYEIRQVTSLAEAIRTINKFPYDIILLDLGLKDCSSLQALGSLVSFIDAPIVVLTGNEDRSIAFKSLELGAQDFLSKSDNLRLILPKTISFAIQRYRTQKELIRTEELLARQAEWEQRSNERLRCRLAEKEVRAAVAENTHQHVAIVDQDGVNWVNKSLRSDQKLNQKSAGLKEITSQLPAVVVLQVEQAIADCTPLTHAWLENQTDEGTVLKRVELFPIDESPGIVQQFVLTMSADVVAIC